MQFTDKKELVSLSTKDLHKEIYETKKHLRALKFNAKQGNLKDSSQLAKARKHHARLTAIRKQREREATQKTTEQPAKKAA